MLPKSPTNHRSVHRHPRIGWAVLLLVLSAVAVAVEPELRAPSWTYDVIEQSLQHDAVPGMYARAAPWTRTTGDGGVLLTALPTEHGFVIRTFDADGTLLHRLVENEAALFSDPTPITASLHALDDGGALVLLRRMSGCRVLRVSSSGLLVARDDVVLGLAAESCGDVAVTADGGFVIQGIRTIRAFAPDGEIRWTYQPTLQGNSHPHLHRLKRVGDVLWSIAQTQSDPVQQVVLRIALDGSELSSTPVDCGGCEILFPRDMAGLTDGGIALAGYPSFVALFAENGAMQSLTWLEDMPGIQAIESNALDELYLQGESDSRHIARFDPKTQSIAWSLIAEAFAATASGLAVVQRTLDVDAAQVRLLDGEGKELGAVPADAVAEALTPWLVAHGDDVDAFVTVHAIAEFATPTCSEYPRVTHVRPVGATIFAKACSRPVAASILGAASDAAGNRFVRTGNGLISFTAAGRERWRHQPCWTCGTGHNPWSEWSELTVDGRGGVWAVWQHGSQGVTSTRTLIHLASDGSRDVAVPMDTFVEHNAPFKLLLSAHGLDVLWTSATSAELVVSSLDTHGTWTAERRAALPEPRFNTPFVIFDAIRRGDGEPVVVLRKYANPCLPPYCDTTDTALMRIGPDGARWTAMSSLAWSRFSLRQDGTLWSIEGSYPSRVERIRPDGDATLSALVPLPGDEEWFDRIAGPLSQGRMLLPASDVLRLINPDGSTAFTRTTTPYQYTYASVVESKFGYLLSIDHPTLPADAELRDATTLRLLARFGSLLPPAIDDMPSGPGLWDVTIDGSVMAFDSRDENQPDSSATGRRTRMMVFSIPGSPAADRILIDGLEP